MRLSRFADIAVIALCFVSVGYVAQAIRSRGPAPRESYSVGQTVKDNGTLNLKGATRTLIFMTVSTCHFCAESMPFFADVVRRAQQMRLRVVAVTAEPTEIHRNYWRRYGVEPDAVADAKSAGLTFAETPYLLVVDGRGTILETWRGKPQPREERAILQSLNGQPTMRQGEPQ